MKHKHLLTMAELERQKKELKKKIQELERKLMPPPPPRPPKRKFEKVYAPKKITFHLGEFSLKSSQQDGELVVKKLKKEKGQPHKNITLLKQNIHFKYKTKLSDSFKHQDFTTKFEIRGGKVTRKIVKISPNTFISLPVKDKTKLQ